MLVFRDARQPVAEAGGAYPNQKEGSRNQVDLKSDGIPAQSGVPAIDQSRQGEKNTSGTVSLPGQSARFAVSAGDTAGLDGEVGVDARARDVENYANRSLEQLATTLDLTEAQQDRIFDILVRRSPNFDPSMIPADAAGRPLAGVPVVPVAGSPPGTDSAATGAEDAPASSATAADEILEVLEPDQAVEYIESEADRIAWWTEFLEAARRAHESAERNRDRTTPPTHPGNTAGYGGR